MSAQNEDIFGPFLKPSVGCLLALINRLFIWKSVLWMLTGFIASILVCAYWYKIGFVTIFIRFDWRYKSACLLSHSRLYTQMCVFKICLFRKNISKRRFLRSLKLDHVEKPRELSSSFWNCAFCMRSKFVETDNLLIPQCTHNLCLLKLVSLSNRTIETSKECA